MRVKKGSFVTIFLSARNVHCYKDVGMIPKTFSTKFGYSSYLVCRGDGEYDHSGDLKIVKIGGGRLLSEIRLLRFLCINAKNIEILNLYHWGRHTYIVGRFYKILNPKGKLYVKCDIDDRGLNVIKCNKNVQQIFSKIATIADLISCESVRITNELNQLCISRVKWVPNGFFSTEMDWKPVKKEKIILTVGRLGTEQKATENLVEAFRCIAGKNPEWQLVLVGSMTSDFKKYVSELCNSNEWLKNRIILTGEIRDKLKLGQIYSKASIFALPSRWESFAIVSMEALSHGCYFIGTEGMAPIRDIIINDNLGKIIGIDNIDELSMAITRAIGDERNFGFDMQTERSRYVKINYSWSVICSKIMNLLNGE